MHSPIKATTNLASSSVLDLTMTKPGKIQVALEVVSLTATTLILLAVFITSGLAGSPNANKFGLKNATEIISYIFHTQVCKTVAEISPT